MRALIIGTGVAGTVAAMALHKAGVEAEVFEAYEESAGLAHGVFLTVAVNGLDALRAIDAHHVVRAAGFPSGKIHFSSGTGRRLGSIALGPELPDGTVTQTLKRSDLYGGLYAEAVRRGIRITHGKRLNGAEQRPGGGVVAHFADGTSAEGDVLIGADGVRSVTRTLIDPEAPGPRYTGLGNVGGYARVPGVRTVPGDYEMIWGRECFFGYTVGADGEVWWFANPPSRTELTRAETALTDERVRERLISLLSVDHTPAAEIVRSTQDNLRIFNQYDLPTVPRWHNDRMVVIGDAAHAVSPASGQGASLAAEDAVVLALCLRDASSIPAALAEFERRRRDRVQRIVAWGASMNNTKKQGLVGRFMRDLMVPIIMRRNSRPEAMNQLSWIFNHHIDWSTPPR
jgi:2-polyprenyl-6-methoxyphenol hydroxylase-like FAD-dependent oxidoreductase